MTASLKSVSRTIATWRSLATSPLVVGICGAQGSGKSTLAAGLDQHFTDQGVAVAVLSLDDLYLSPQDRPTDMHPLFATRGVPGTHDVGLGIAVIDALKARKQVALPRFDKATDTPCPASEWPVQSTPVDLILFEGWCVGAVPQPAQDLVEPVNVLERDEDPDAVWRRHINAQLAGAYTNLFARLDRLVLLAAPDFAVVTGWRGQQERDLEKRLVDEGRSGRIMSQVALTRFVQHYERLTRYILREMPHRADLTLSLDQSRNPL